MQLNESTYETIFLLYIDKELSPKERLEVERFIAANPSYAIEMEALQATVLSPEKISYPYKKNLQQQTATSLEDLEKEWNQTYSAILKENLEAIPELSASFKNTLKKASASESIVVKSFGFSQQKYTYAAVAACLMIFLGYQQFTKAPVSNSIVSNSNAVIVPNVSKASDETITSNANKNQVANVIEFVAKTKKTISDVQAASTDKINMSKGNKNESFLIAEISHNKIDLNQQVVITNLPSNYNNPTTIDAIPTETVALDIDTESTIDEKGVTNYEVIDTEDPNRTIFIANFEIDGNKFRGLKRKVTSLFKNNKSDRNK